MQAVLYAEAWVDSSAGTCPTGVNKRPAWYPDSGIKMALVLLFFVLEKKDGWSTPAPPNLQKGGSPIVTVGVTKKKWGYRCSEGCGSPF